METSRRGRPSQGPRREMGGRQVLDGGPGLRKAVFDGAGNRRDRAFDSRARRADARSRLGQRCPVVRGIQRPHHLQAGSGDGHALARIQLTKDDPEPHGLDIRNGVLWYCDAASGWICRWVPSWRAEGNRECGQDGDPPDQAPPLEPSLPGPSRSPGRFLEVGPGDRDGR